MVVQGATTAIQRKTPPEPLRWLYSNNQLRGRVLDYGSGRQCWYGMVCYDPHWRPIPVTGPFDTIVCCYVLNVVTPAVQKTILTCIHKLLRPGGSAYIAVRRDTPKTGKVGRGVYQRYVVLKLPSVRKTSGYEIYRMYRE